MRKKNSNRIISAFLLAAVFASNLVPTTGYADDVVSSSEEVATSSSDEYMTEAVNVKSGTFTMSFMVDGVNIGNLKKNPKYTDRDYYIPERDDTFADNEQASEYRYVAGFNALLLKDTDGSYAYLPKDEYYVDSITIPRQESIFSTAKSDCNIYVSDDPHMPEGDYAFLQTGNSRKKIKAGIDQGYHAVAAIAAFDTDEAERQYYAVETVNFHLSDDTIHTLKEGGSIVCSSIRQRFMIDNQDGIVQTKDQMGTDTLSVTENVAYLQRDKIEADGTFPCIQANEVRLTFKEQEPDNNSDSKKENQNNDSDSGNDNVIASSSESEPESISKEESTSGDAEDDGSEKQTKTNSALLMKPNLETAENADDFATKLAGLPQDNRIIIKTKSNADDKISDMTKDAQTVGYDNTYITSCNTLEAKQAAMEKLSEDNAVDLVIDDSVMQICDLETDGESVLSESDTAEKENKESVSTSSENRILADSSDYGNDQADTKPQEDEKEAVHPETLTSDHTKKTNLIEKSEAENTAEIKPAEESIGSDVTTEYAEIKKMAAGRPVIALIDTGSDDADYAVNFTENSEKDVNGHGTRMAKLIRENAGKDVFILSLKAMNDNGTGTFSNVLAAIRYAKEHHADYINMSISVRDSDETKVLKEELNAAAAEGIAIIAAAGNYGSDAKDYFPGNLDYVQTAGYKKDDGTIGELSNYGKSVNWYVKSNSTSEAAAILTGVKAGGKNPEEDVRFAATVKGTVTENSDDDTSKFKTQMLRGNVAQKIYNAIGRSSHCKASGATDYGTTAETFCAHHGFFSGYGDGNMGWNDPISRYQLGKVAERLKASYTYDQAKRDDPATDAEINSVISGIRISAKTYTVSYSNSYRRDTVFEVGGYTDSVEIRSGTADDTYDEDYYAYFYDQDPVSGSYPSSYSSRDWDRTRYYYKFKCWTDGSRNYYPTNTYSDTSDIYLYPKYESSYYDSTDLYTVSFPSESKLGYTMQGWYTSKNGRGTRYTPGDDYRIDDSQNFYSYYTANPYSVTLNKNGGDGGNNGLYYTYNTNTIYNNSNHSTAITKVEIPKRAGYEFAGYYIGSTQIVNADGGINGTYIYRTAENQTAYAKWKFQVKFNSNAPSAINPQKIDGWEMKDTGNNAMSKQTINASENDTLTPVKYSAFGYTFAGWSLMPGDNQTISFTNGGQININPEPDAGSVITLYAQWKKDAATVTYNNLNGASNSNPSTYAPADGEWTLKDLKRSDAAFLGWTGSNGNTPQKNVLITRDMLMSNPDLTFTANWRTIKPYLFVDSSTMFTPILKGTADNGGKFRLIESKPADGYILDKTPVDLDITKSGTNYSLKDHVLNLDITNQANRYTIKKVDDADKPLAGAKFEVWYGNDTQTKQEYISDDKGEINLYGLKPGVWHYREVKAPKGYFIIYDAEYDIVVNSDGTIRGAAENTISNTKSQPENQLIIKKQDENGASIAGAKFTIICPDGYTINAVTDNAGLIILKNNHIAEGVYTVQETETKEGYILDNSVHSFHAVSKDQGLIIQETGNNYYVITNKANNLTIRKTDADFREPIPGVSFDIWQGAEKTEDTMHKVTNENGEIVLSALKSGTWHYQETSAPSGYQFDSDIHTFTVADNGLISSDEAEFTTSADRSEAALSITNQKNHFEIHKVDQDNKPLSGISFLITSDSGYRETKKTDTDGRILLQGLPVGVYTYAEQPTDGYVMDGKAYTFTVSNSGITPDFSTLPAIVNTENEFILHKTDEKGNALSGVTFHFSYEGQGTNPFAKDAYLTDSDGQIIFHKLPAGTYTFEETKTKDNTYRRDQETHSFKVSTTGELTTTDTTLKAEGLNTAVLKMVCPNAQYSRFRVTVTKRDSDNNKLLNEAAFGLYDKDNKKIASLTRTGEGIYQSDYIQLTDAMMDSSTATFTVRETTVPQGYAGVYEHTFSIEPSKNTGDLDYAFEAGNQPNEAVIKKISDQGLPLSGVVFKIWKQGENAGEYTTDNNGLITMSKLSNGTWHYQEIKTLGGYVLDSTDRTFTVTETGIDGSPKKTFSVVNKLRTPKTVEIVLKKQSTNGKDLSGAEFDVQQWDSSEGANGSYVSAGNMRYDEQTKSYKNDVVLTVTNTNKGKFKITETKAPVGYLCDWSKEITVADDEKTSETVSLTAVNESNQFTLMKTDDGGAPIANAVFTLAPEDPAKFETTVDTKTLTTNSEGKATVQALVPGSYLLTEISTAPGYAVDAEQKRLVVNDDATMCVYGLGIGGYDENGDPLPEKETGTAGKLTYTVKNSKNVFTIHKTAGNGADAASLPGAVFSVWKEETGSTRTSYTTDDHGDIRLTGLTEGTWKFQETKAPQGYRLPTTVYTFYVTDKGTLYMDGQSADTASETLEKTVANFQNYPTGQIKVRKVDKDNPNTVLENATFDLMEYRMNTKTYQKIGTLAWNQDTRYYEASVTMSDQNAGLFRVVETKAPSGYTADWSADIDLSKKLNWIFDDTSTETQHETSAVNAQNELKIHKVDADEQSGIEGIAFDLCSEDNTDVRTGTTDSSGYVSFRKLTSGMTYKLRENPELTQNPYYQLDTSWKLVTVDAGGKISMDSHAASSSYTETIANDKKDTLAQIRLRKVDAYNTDDIIDSASFDVYQYSNVLGQYESTPYGSLTYDAETSEYVSPYLKYTAFNEGKFKVVEVGRPSPSYVSSWSKEYQFKPNDSGTVHMFGTASDEEGNTYETITNLPIHMQTQASDDTTGSNIMVPAVDASVTDTVTLDNLEAGKTYRLVGRLMNGFSDNKYIPDRFSVNGRTFEDAVTFTVPASPSKGQAFTNISGSSQHTTEIINVKKDDETPQGTVSGTVTMNFKFDSSNAAGSQMVFFEYLYDASGNLVASHTDLDDDKQSVMITIPDIHTTLTNKATGDHNGQVSNKDTLVDTVAYKYLSNKLKYRLVGTLIHGETKTGKWQQGETVKDSSGREITKTVDFTPAESDGTTDVVFDNFDTTEYAGCSVTAYEKLYLVQNGREILLTEHNSATDLSQTVYYQGVHTNAATENQYRASDDKQTGPESGEDTIWDTVEISGLMTGVTSKDDDVTIGNDGTYLYTRKITIGTADYQIHGKLMSRTADGKQVYVNGKPIDITVNVHIDGRQIAPSTAANPSGSGITVTSMDGKTNYQVSNVVVRTKDVEISRKTNAKTGEEISKTTQTAPVSVDFTVKLPLGGFDAKNLEGQHTVVFEQLYHQQALVAEHSDIYDMGQSIRFPMFTELFTGGNGIYGRTIIGLIALAGFAISIFVYKKKRKNK